MRFTQALLNLTILAAVALAVYWCDDGWPLLGLFLLADSEKWYDQETIAEDSGSP